MINIGRHKSRSHPVNTVARVLAAVILLAAVALGCTFRFGPAFVPRYYRSEGWFVPQGEPDSRYVPLDGRGYPVPVENVPGMQVYAMPRDTDPYIAIFPEQVFTLNGTPQKMQPVMARAAMVRIEMHGRVAAYSFGLVPVEAHRKGGRWVIDATAACIFYATFIDDKGDGVFRVLVPAPFTAEVVPGWAKKAKGS